MGLQRDFRRDSGKTPEWLWETWPWAASLNPKGRALSGGEKQRVQIGRILCQVWDNIDSAFVFFDEPTAELDLAHQLIFFDVIKMLATKGASVSLVLHDINLASRFSDDLVLLRSGRILAMGPPQEVVTKENMRAAFSVETEVHHLFCRPTIQASSVVTD